ncbi:MAG: PHP domain-containing protein [Desulfobacterales bacterium]
MDCNQPAVDLHIHTTASDGTFSPVEVLYHAEKIGLKAISITDHDTVSGVIEAQNSGISKRIGFLTGVEISADMAPVFEAAESCHILGYCIDPENPYLIQILRKLGDARKNRNPQIIEKLRALNFDITLEDVLSHSVQDQVGRPQIAEWLVKRNFVTSINEAFDKYLSRGRPAYVDKYRISSAEAIRLIRISGGIPVLAHPFLIHPDNPAVLENMIPVLKDMGLMGIEVFYSGHSPDMTDFLADIARRNNLLMTGGTDFHGTLTPDIQMGKGKGDLVVPYEIYEKLAAACRMCRGLPERSRRLTGNRWKAPQA